MDKLKKYLKNPKVMVAAVVTVVAVIAAALLLKEETYRTVAVDEVHGITLVSTNGKSSVNAYEGMHLYSGDDVSVQQEADMTMVLDMDKYLYAEPGTHFWLECKGTTDDSQTKILLDEGSVLNHIKDNLNEGEVYEVDTPNSTMAVRGTVYRVSVLGVTNDFRYTLLEVFEGKTKVDLKYENGEYNGVSETFAAGEAALIRSDGNSTISEFVPDESGNIKRKIAYKEIPQDTARKLVGIIDGGTDLCIGKELLMDYTRLAEHRMSKEVSQDPTCEEDGYEGFWCEVCEEIIQTNKIAALGHKYEKWIVLEEPTCEETGEQERICEVCGYVDQKEIKELGHDTREPLTVKEPSCTEEGEQEVYCDVCEKLVTILKLRKVPHTDGETVTVREPDCTHEGAAELYCEVCEQKMADLVLDPLGHTPEEIVVIREATCTEEGEAEYYCTVCRQKVTNAVIEKAPHTEKTVVVKEPTCIAKGSNRTECTVCGTVLARAALDKIGHTWGNVITLSVGTCGELGYDQTICTVCGEENIWDTGVGEHMVGEFNIISEADCVNSGRAEAICTVCGAVVSENVTPATGHSMHWEENYPASCIEEGQEIGTCSACGEEDTRSIAMIPHEYEYSHYGLSEDMSTVMCEKYCYMCGEDREVTQRNVIMVEEGDGVDTWEVPYCECGRPAEGQV